MKLKLKELVLHNYEEIEDTKRGNQNPLIEEGQTTQWSKKKGQKDKQRSTKHTHKTKDRITRTPLKPGCTQVLRKQGRSQNKGEV